MSDDLVRDIEARDFDEDMAKNLAEIVRISVQAGKDEAATALTEARAEIERLRGEIADTKDDFLRRHKDAVDRFERIGQLESELSTLRARVREVVGPFAEQADGTRLCGAEFGDDWKPFLHRSYTEVDITNGHLRAARQLMEEVK